MADNKTKATNASLETYLATVKDPARREDCVALIALMRKATKEPPKMWGSSIVGFGNYHYLYESGREGDTCTVGFASRKNGIVLYGLGSFSEREKLAARLGQHEWGKGCLYLGRLSEIDLKVLDQLIAGAFAERTEQQ